MGSISDLSLSAISSTVVYCAIYGDPFCTSAWTSFAILWRNLARVAAINLVGNYIAMLGKLLVSFGATGIIVQVLSNGKLSIIDAVRWYLPYSHEMILGSNSLMFIFPMQWISTRTMCHRLY